MKNNPEFKYNPEINTSFQHFLKLKEKELNQEISFEELSFLLSTEFRQFVSTNPSIEEEFDPEKELKNIKSLPKELRMKELAPFKEKLTTQKLALAECRIYLERLIRHSPDIDRRFLDRTIQIFKDKYGFSEAQLKVFRELLDKYKDLRSDLKLLRERFPNDSELFTFVTNINVDDGDKVEVFLDPVNFYFRVNSSLAAKLMPNKVVSKKEKYWSDSGTRGFKINFDNLLLDGKKYEVLGIFLPTKDEVSDQKDFSKTLRHEREHVTNDILKDYFFENGKSVTNRERVNPKFLKTREQIESLLNRVYQTILDRTQDELIAQLISKTGDEKKFLTDFKLSYKTIIGKFLFGWGYYNYFEYYDIEEPYFKDLRDDIWASKIHFLKERYKKDLEKSAKAFWSLINEGNFTLNQAIALLTDKKLLDWPKEAKRILELQRKS